MSVITISRQFGAGGKTMGEMIAKNLGYNFFDTELIQMVAEKANVSTEWVHSVEKEAGGKLQKFISGLVSKKFVDQIIGDDRGYIDEEVYVDSLHQIIAQIADEGDAVILGRGSQYILQERKKAVHVLLIAEMEDRVKFMETHYELSRSKAAQIVNRQDQRRASLYKKFGRQDYDREELYHVVLNMSKLNLEQATEAVCLLAKATK